MVRLRQCQSQDVALAVELHEFPARTMLFSGPELTSAVAVNWFEGHPRYLMKTILVKDQPVGLVWLDAYAPGENAYVTIGLTKRGQGYGREAVPHILRWCFLELKLHRLSTTVVDGNGAAESIARAFGVDEGRLSEAFKDQDGKYHDVLIYGLLASEWKE